MNAKESKAGEFNKILMEICLGIIHRMPNDMDMHSTWNKIKIAKQVDTESIIQISGPFLWKYRDNIREGNFNFLFIGEFDEADEIKKNNEYNIIYKKISQCFANDMSAAERKYIIDRIKSMFYIYVEYLALCKK